MSSGTVFAASGAARKQGRTTERVTDSGVMAWTLGLVALGILLYRPWQRVPFDITDYSEILPLLKGATGGLDSLRALLAYYLGHGRTNVLTSALIWIQWELFGAHAPAWRLFRALLFGILLWQFLRTARLFHSSPLAAGLGASLFVVSRPAAEGWLRLTGEPLATIFFLAAIGVAAGFHTSVRPMKASLVLAFLSAGMILTKETMVVCVPLVFLVAATWRGEQGFRIPKPDRRLLVVATALGAVVALSCAAILLVSRSSPPEAYARVYGSASLDLVRFQYNALAIIWPLGEPFRFFSAYGTITSWAVVLGLLLAIRRGPPASIATGIGLLLLVSVAGALVYLPWQRLETFYAIPFLVGPAGLLAIASQGWAGRHRLRRALTTGLLASILLPPAAAASRDASARAATRWVDSELARAIQDLPEGDTLVFAVLRKPDQAWQGRAPTMARYSAALFGDGRVPPSAEETCDEVGHRLNGTPPQGEIIVSYHHWCGPLPGADRTITRNFQLLFLRPLGFQAGRVSADLLLRKPPTPAGEGSAGA